MDLKEQYPNEEFWQKLEEAENRKGAFLFVIGNVSGALIVLATIGVVTLIRWAFS